CCTAVMPRHIDTNNRTGEVLRSADRILLERGITGLTLRAIAAETRISLGSLTSHYDNRRRLLHLLAMRSGHAWVTGIAERIWSDGVRAFLPATDDDSAEEHDFQHTVAGTRVWLSWCELARSAPELRGTVGDVRLEERALLDRATERRLDVDDLDIALGLAHGLRAAVCAGDEPMPLAHARRLLDTHVQRALARVDQPETA
ncbi:MAG: TetR/AcrR family transcriptional regulator, partial [Nocardioides sp.]